MAVRPDRHRIVAAHVRASRVEIYDDRGELLTRVASPREVEVGFGPNGSLRRDLPYAYQDVAASNNYIYGLFSGMGGDAPYYAETVHVFSWDGHLAEILHLERPVTRLTVTPDDQRIIGVTDKPFPQLVLFELGDR